MDLLTLKGLTKRFGGVAAVNDVSFTVKAGTIHSLIGPNGSGKTTTFNLITGFLPPSAGEIHFGDRRIDGMPSHRIARHGIARTFQNLKVFGEMTVLENLLTGRHFHIESGFLSSVAGLPGAVRAEERARQACMALLELVGIPDLAGEPAKNLPYGKQRLLEIGRALATKPKLLLLDEPAAGLNSRESVDLVNKLERIRAEGITILLVEHDLRVVMGVSESITVLDYGRKIAEGTPEEIRKNPVVIEAYLGRGIA